MCFPLYFTADKRLIIKPTRVWSVMDALRMDGRVPVTTVMTTIAIRASRQD